MSWLDVAKRTLIDPYRTRYLWILLGIVALLFGLVTHSFVGRISSGMTTMSLGASLVGVGFMFVPLIAIACSYSTIAGRRQNGSLRVVLSYPNSRWDIVLGTVLGRCVLIAGLVSFGFLVACAVALVESGLPTVRPFLLVWLAALLLGIAMTGLAVGISASARTTNRAALTSFGAFFLFFLWQPGPIHALLNRFSLTQSLPSEWVDIFVALNPIQAYNTIVSDLTSSMSDVSGFYATEWFGALVLLAWLVLPLLIGGWQFGRSDL